jgi:predicted alpha/beta hydrolase family esterase
MIALTADDRFSIVTVVGADTPAPAWQTMFGWPAAARTAVPLSVRSTGERNLWAARMDEAIRGADRTVLLVADGLGCAASAWWARLSPSDYVSRIAGALLFAPGQEQAHGLFESPQTRLPFPSLVIQPGAATSPALRSTVEDWGSRLILGERERRRGSGAVAWRQAQRLFLRLTEQVVAHDVDRARSIAGRR